jgi:hypothetical protein
MSAAVAIIVASVLSTAELCADPVQGGRGEPDFCRISAPERIDTPFFSVVADSEMLIGVDQAGRRILIQFSINQNQAGLLIHAIPRAELSKLEKAYAGVRLYLTGKLRCQPRELGDTAWEWCVENDLEEKNLSQRYLLQTPTDVYYVEHHSSRLGRVMDPVIARLLQTLVVHGI